METSNNFNNAEASVINAQTTTQNSTTIMGENFLKAEAQPIGATMAGEEATQVSQTQDNSQGEIKATSEKAMVSSPKSKKVKATIEKIGPDVMDVQRDTIKKMLSDSRYHATSIPGTDNVIINLTEFVKEGGRVVRQSKNRTHGKDMKTTGESLMEYGSQVPLVVMPLSVAKAAGIEYECFASDPKDGLDEDKELVLVVIEGHGRCEYLLGEDVNEWLTVLAVLPSPDKRGELHPDKAFIETNVNSLTWKGNDYMIIRLADPACHPGWKRIKEKEDAGFKFTIATIFSTGREGAVSKRSILNADTDVNELFKHSEHCERIYDAAVKKFGCGKDSVLQTKAIPNKIFECWSELKDGKFDVSQATELIVRFFDTLDSGIVLDINNAKKEGDKERDTVRKELFTKAFNEYKSKYVA